MEGLAAGKVLEGDGGGPGRACDGVEERLLGWGCARGPRKRMRGWRRGAEKVRGDGGGGGDPGAGRRRGGGHQRRGRVVPAPGPAGRRERSYL